MHERFVLSHKWKVRHNGRHVMDSLSELVAQIWAHTDELTGHTIISTKSLYTFSL